MKVLYSLCAIFAVLFSAQSSDEVHSTDISLSSSQCLSHETRCGNNCCPYTNATCCSKTLSCCREGAVCLGSYPMCLSLQDGSEPLALHSEPSADLRITDCPSGTTACPGGCCPFPNAVCCEDASSCCPQTYSCDVSGLCVKDETILSRFLKAILVKSYPSPSLVKSSGQFKKTSVIYPYPLRAPYGRPVFSAVSQKSDRPGCCSAFGIEICCPYPICSCYGFMCVC